MLERSAMKENVVQIGDAVTLLGSLPDARTPFVFFDPNTLGVFDHLGYGNEGSAELAAMSNENIDACCREMARSGRPAICCAGSILPLCEADYLRIARQHAVTAKRGMRSCAAFDELCQVAEPTVASNRVAGTEPRDPHRCRARRCNPLRWHIRSDLLGTTMKIFGVDPGIQRRSGDR
jgi:hypothetical protein